MVEWPIKQDRVGCSRSMTCSVCDVAPEDTVITEQKTARDWTSLLLIPAALLFLNWLNTARSDANTRSRQLRQERTELITHLIQDIWSNGVSMEIIGQIDADGRNDLRNSDYVTAKREFNESESRLYVDKLKIEILFQDDEGQSVANAVREYIALGGDNRNLVRYARDQGGVVKEKKEAIQSLSLQLLKRTIDRVKSAPPGK